MKPNLLTAQEYDDLCYKFISEVEGYEERPYWDNENILTIGVGFNVDCPADNKNKDYSIYRKVVILRKINQFDRNKIPSFDDINFTTLMKTSKYEDIYKKFINDTSAAIFKIITNNRPKTKDNTRNKGKGYEEFLKKINDKLNSSVAASNKSIDAEGINNKVAKETYEAAHIPSNLTFTLTDGEIKDIYDAIVFKKVRSLKTALESGKIGVKYLTSFIDEDSAGVVKRDFIKSEFQRYHQPPYDGDGPECAPELKATNIDAAIEASWAEKKRYPQELIPFLSNHYQQPAKFGSYNDAPAFLKCSLKKRKSRFLTWFGIRYYMDRTSINNKIDNNQAYKDTRSRYAIHSRRIKEAAIFGILNLQTFNENKEKAKYEACLDIFTHLNTYLDEIRTGNNHGLSHYRDERDYHL